VFRIFLRVGTKRMRGDTYFVYCRENSVDSHITVHAEAKMADT